MRIKGTFLDEISHDIPHQNWGEAEWDRDFGYMREAGIDTVILIRCGYRRWQTFPSRVLTAEEGVTSRPSIWSICSLRLSDKWGMNFWFGLYDSGKYWDRGEYEQEVALNKRVIDEAWSRYGHYESFRGLVYFAGMQPQYRQDRRSVRESGMLLQGGFRRSADHDFPLYRRQQERQSVNVLRHRHRENVVTLRP